MTIISIEVHYIKMAQVLYQLFYVGANVRKLIVLGTSYLYVPGSSLHIRLVGCDNQKDSMIFEKAQIRFGFLVFF